MIARLLLCAGLVGGAIGCGAEAPHAAPPATPSSVAAEQTAIVPVDGMSCATCAAKITRALESTPGVVHAEVSLERKEATIRYREGETTPEALAGVVAGSGFEAGSPKVQSP